MTLLEHRPQTGPPADEPLRQPLPVTKLIAFAVVGFLALGYLVFSVIGSSSFKGSYSVAVHMPESGGLFPGSQVAYRGVPVGTVSSIDIEPARDDIVATMTIHDGTKVPASTIAQVSDRSPAGAQYLDLQPPKGSGAPYLHGGSSIDNPKQVRLPPSLGGLLNSVTAFSNSIDIKQLRTVFNQLEIGFGGTGPALGRIIDNSAKLLTSLEAVEPATINLLTTAGQVLDTQAQHLGDLRTFSVSLHRLADTLRADDPKTAALIQNALTTTQTVGPLLSQDSQNIGMLLANLVTVGHIAVQRIPGLNALLVALPGGLNALASAVSGGTVHFTLLTSLGNACAYPGTRREQPFDGHRGGPITNGYCLHPKTTQQQRGTVYEPRPPGDDTAGPGGASSSTASSTQSSSASSKSATPSSPGATASGDSWTQIFTDGES
jgi:phospholipid/cholesterol/gamma-HCH transport system substrate-binding protein